MLKTLRMNLWKLKRLLGIPYYHLRGRWRPRQGRYPEYEALLTRMRGTGKGMLVGWDPGGYAYEIPEDFPRRNVRHVGHCPLSSHDDINYSQPEKAIRHVSAIGD
jgi:hypothetical protein